MPADAVRDEQRNVLKYSYHLNTQYPVRAYVVAKNHRNDPVRHDVHAALEMGIMLDGTSRRFTGNHQKDIGPGDVWFCSTYERHGYKPLIVPNKCVVALVAPEFLSTLKFPESPDVDWMAPFKAPPEQRPTIPFTARKETLAIGQRLTRYVDFETSNEVPPLLARLFVLEILFMIQGKGKGWVGHSMEASISQAPATQSAEYAKVLPAVDLVLQSRRIVKIKEAADACGMSRDRFLFHFRKATGNTFGKFVLHHRISGAICDLLSSSRLVKSIAHDWGFTDGSHLHKALLKYNGKTPGEIRTLSESPVTATSDTSTSR